MAAFPFVVKFVTNAFYLANIFKLCEYQVFVFTNFSKVFKKLIYTQINSFMEPKFSKYLAGFRKNHNTQHTFLKVIETWRSMRSKGNKVGTIIMDFSKAFDILNRNLLLCI